MNIKNLFKPAVNFVSKHDTGLLTAAIIGSTLASVYFTYKNGPKCRKILEELGPDAKPMEKVKALAPVAAPTIISATISVGATLAMNQITSKRIEKLASICSVHQIANTLHDEYEKKVKEIVGEEKAEEIQEAASKEVAKKSFESHTLSSDGALGSNEYCPIETGHGNDLFYLEWTDQWFRADIAFVKDIFTALNYQLTNELSIGVQELQANLGLPTIPAFKDQVWNIDFGTIDARYYAELTDTDRVYTTIHFHNEPVDRYVGTGRAGSFGRY